MRTWMDLWENIDSTIINGYNKAHNNRRRNLRHEQKTEARRGLALIFNYEEFDFARKLEPRFGSNFDYDRMQISLKCLGFKVKAFKNLKTEDVKKEIDDAAKADHSNADCFVLVFMSRGLDDYVCTYDGNLSMKDITDKFKGTECKGLLRKPKIFIWETARGRELDQPYDGDTTDNVAEHAVQITTPAAADFIMCYSSAEGYNSIRDTNSGSWYIQELCDLLEADHTRKSLEFTELLTLVSANVSRKTTVMIQKHKWSNVKQMPCFASMLTKNLYF